MFPSAPPLVETAARAVAQVALATAFKGGLGLVGLGQSEDFFEDGLGVGFAELCHKERDAGCGRWNGSGTTRQILRAVLSTLILLNRAVAAPCETALTCSGCPLPSKNEPPNA